GPRPAEPRLPQRRADPRAVHVHRRERVTAAPLDGASAQDALTRAADDRSGRARRRVHALDPLELAADPTLAAGPFQVEGAGSNQRGEDGLYRAVPAGRAEAPLHVHALRVEPNSLAAAWRTSDCRRRGDRPARSAHCDARRHLLALIA